jgi:hypothetical protein
MTPPERDPDAERRAKWVGRAMIIGLGLLLLAYIIPTFLNRPH